MSMDKDGYRRVKVSGKYIAVHRKILQDAGIDVTGKVVHHIDGNKLNNNLDNLKVFNDHSEHSIYHAYEALRKKGCDPNTHKVCSTCGLVLERDKFGVRSDKPGLRCVCKVCENKRSAARRKKKRATG